MMIRMVRWAFTAVILLWCPLLLANATTSPAQTQPSSSLDPRFTIGPLEFSDDFNCDSGQWITELEKGGSVTFGQGRMDINVPAGASVWFKPMLRRPSLIQYEATVIKSGGPNDRVSDLNCFWMARDSRNLADIFAVKRSGKFADYNPLLTYYVGLGGNGNSTTRFRRYIGDPIQRPLLPKFDLHDNDDLITPNVPQFIQLVGCGPIIQYYRDGKRIFDFEDDQPYTSGWFALRTTWNHMEVRAFKVFELEPIHG
jgi:hypothetical protein